MLSNYAITLIQFCLSAIFIVYFKAIVVNIVSPIFMNSLVNYIYET